jgi:hypothetical protein
VTEKLVVFSGDFKEAIVISIPSLFVNFHTKSCGNFQEATKSWSVRSFADTNYYFFTLFKDAVSKAEVISFRRDVKILSDYEETRICRNTTIACLKILLFVCSD